jgi:hypothetical protein
VIARATDHFPGELNVTIFSRTFVRRRIISLATTLTFSATSFALAQAPKGALHLQALASEADERQFLFANDLAISSMSRAMLVHRWVTSIRISPPR